MSGTQRTRVMRVIGRLNMGGPAHQAALLSGRRLDPDRYETLLVHGSLAPGEESLADLAEREGARMHYLPELQQPVHPVRDLLAQAKLIGLARRFRPQIVHTHTAKAGFLGRQAALATRPRPAIVHTFHGHVLEGYFGQAKSRLYRSLERVLGCTSDRLIGVSQATVDDLVRLGVARADKFKVLHLGLDLALLSEPAPETRRKQRAALELTEDDVLLVFVGRVVAIKRLDVLLDALATARAAGTPVKLALVGDGDCRPALEQQAAQLGLNEAVHFLGYRRELQPIFAAADIAVLTSANEGTPVSLIEAAAAGVPAVATDVGGVSEVVSEETGILAPSGDASAVAAGIERLAADAELRSKLGTAAMQRSIRRYGARRLLADIDALYTEILSGHS